MTYRTAASLVAVVCAVLALLFILAPHLYAPTYGVEADTGAVFITRRAGPGFLGLALILWVSRDAPASKLRGGVAMGAALCFAGVAATGVFDWARGVASASILIAAVSEVLLAVVLIYTSRNSA